MDDAQRDYWTEWLTVELDIAYQDRFWQFPPDQHDLVQQVFQEIRDLWITWFTTTRVSGTSPPPKPPVVNSDWEHTLMVEHATGWAHVCSDTATALRRRHPDEEYELLRAVICEAGLCCGKACYNRHRKWIREQHGLPCDWESP